MRYVVIPLARFREARGYASFEIGNYVRRRMPIQRRMRYKISINDPQK